MLAMEFGSINLRVPFSPAWPEPAAAGVRGLSFRANLGSREFGRNVRLLFRSQRRGLVIVSVEHGEQSSDLQQVADVFVEVHQLEFAALVAQRGVAHHQLANARAVDVDYSREVQQNLVVAVAQQLLHYLAQLARGLAEAKLSADVHNGNAVHQSSADLNRHVHSPWQSSPTAQLRFRIVRCDGMWHARSEEHTSELQS